MPRAAIPAGVAVPSLFVRARDALSSFREDLRSPVPGTEGLPRGARFRRRFSFLLGKYGWRLLVVLFVCYLVRDILLYIVLPYLAATHIFAD